MYTYSINRSPILENLLKKNNFSESQNNNCTFEYRHYTSNDTICSSIIGTLPQYITSRFDLKNSLYQVCSRNNCHQFQPETITDLNHFELDGVSNYYAKNVGSTAGQDMYLINNKDELKEETLKLNHIGLYKRDKKFNFI